jgi:hypothetical protein
MLLWKKVSFAGYLSDYMKQDIPLLKRPLFHLSYLASGISLLLYAACWMEI